MLDEPALASSWQVWVAESLLEGFAPDAVVARLVGQGVAEQAARAAVEQTQCSPSYLAAHRVLARQRATQLACKLSRSVASFADGRLPKRDTLDLTELRDTFLAHGVPVVVPGFCAVWPAVAKWSPKWLAETHGSARVRVCMGRTEDPNPSRNHKDLTVEMSLADYVDRVLNAGPSDDLYMLAHHRNLAGPLEGLVQDLPPPPMVDPARVATCTSFWFGPGGTKTTAHHDTTNILFCQIYGRKRVWLASPAMTQFAEGADNFFMADQLSERAAAGEAGIYEVTLEPGDLLLLPAGWWHQVHALEVSISLSFTGLLMPNRYDFYTPGRRGVRA